MVRPARVELTATGLGILCSIHLSYGRIKFGRAEERLATCQGWQEMRLAKDAVGQGCGWPGMRLARDAVCAKGGACGAALRRRGILLAKRFSARQPNSLARRIWNWGALRKDKRDKKDGRGEKGVEDGAAWVSAGTVQSSACLHNSVACFRESQDWSPAPL